MAPQLTGIKGPLARLGGLVQRAGNQFFAGAAITENQYRRLARPNHFDKRAQLFDGMLWPIIFCELVKK